MATFINCTAEGNGMGGFITNNPNTIFNNCIAKNNTGPGFQDTSGVQIIGDFVNILDQVLPKELSLEINLQEVNTELKSIKQELKSSKPKKHVIKNALEKIADYAKVAQGVKAVSDLLLNFPEVIKFVENSSSFF